MTRRRVAGIALLIVLATLALLSVVALTFVSMSRLERSISNNYVDHTRAVLAAESGVEYAVSRIYKLQGRRAARRGNGGVGVHARRGRRHGKRGARLVSGAE